MADEADGLTIARQRIAQEASDKTGFLDLGRLGLTRLPEELLRLTHLRRLELGERLPFDPGFFFGQTSTHLGRNRVNLSELVALPQLEALSVSGTDLLSLIPVAGLRRLREINFAGTPIRDLRPLAQLTALQSINCSFTPISDLGPVAQLSAL
jgi:internalin A